MNSRLVLRALPLVALAALLTGLVTASRATRDIRAAARHIGDKIERLRELQRIRDGNTASPGALAAFESLPVQQPPDLDAMCRTLLPGVDLEVSTEVPVSAGNGWLLRRAALTIEDVPLETLAGFIERAASERPPWRVRDCLIEAVPGAPGHGRVTLALEALHKEDI